IPFGNVRSQARCGAFGAGGTTPVGPGGTTPFGPSGATPCGPGGATPFGPGGATPFGPGGALRRSGRRSGDRPHSPAAVARQHAAKGNLAACPLCTSHRSARLRPARLHPARLHPGLDCRVDTDDDLFAKPSHGCHYSPETVSPKYKVQW